MAELTEHVSNVRTQLALLATNVADRLDEMDEAIGVSTEPTATGDATEDGEVDVLPDNGEDEDVESFRLDDEEGTDDDEDQSEGEADDGAPDDGAPDESDDKAEDEALDEARDEAQAEE